MKTVEERFKEALQEDSSAQAKVTIIIETPGNEKEVVVGTAMIGVLLNPKVEAGGEDIEIQNCDCSDCDKEDCPGREDKAKRKVAFISLAGRMSPAEIGRAIDSLEEVYIAQLARKNPFMALARMASKIQ